MQLQGIVWALAGLATTTVALFAALVQALVFGVRAPRGRKLREAGIAAVGPVVGGLVALVGALLVDQFGLEAKATLDDFWIVLPTIALGVWFLINRRLLRALVGDVSKSTRDDDAPRGKHRGGAAD